MDRVCDFENVDEEKERRCDGSRREISRSLKSRHSESRRKRLAVHKKALKIAQRLRNPRTISGHTDDSNPFGDANLTEQFVWRKKIDKDLTNGLDPRELSLKFQKWRQLDRMAEIEKVKKRREERAMAKAQHEEDMAFFSRARARVEFTDCEKKEEEFEFEQSKVRSEIRLREGRAKPIDVLSKVLNLSDDFHFEMREPYQIYKGLAVKEMQELRSDIKMHLELHSATSTHVQFWEAMMVVCDWEICEARKSDVLNRARVQGQEPPPELVAEDRALHVDEDIETVLQSKSFYELDEMQIQIEAKMLSGTAYVVEYWEAVLQMLHISKAKARLREIHADLRRQRLQRLQDSDHERKEAEDELGSFSRELVQDYNEVVDPDTDEADLERKRAEVLEEQQHRLQDAVRPIVPDADNLELTGPEPALLSKYMGGMEEGDWEGDAILGIGSEFNLESQVCRWHDGYRPRKPKNFNRVHTGYEWNKYNQLHYDQDNPPPKAVQGYKFNIFYPDLVDKTKAPSYYMERDGSTGETCLIRFHAGPPYEDIAFRIVNKEWEFSRKKGFKCTFERGVLQVHFNFERCRSRR